MCDEEFKGEAGVKDGGRWNVDPCASANAAEMSGKAWSQPAPTMKGGEASAAYGIGEGWPNALIEYPSKGTGKLPGYFDPGKGEAAHCAVAAEGEAHKGGYGVKHRAKVLGSGWAAPAYFVQSAVAAGEWPGARAQWCIPGWQPSVDTPLCGGLERMVRAPARPRTRPEPVVCAYAE